MNTDLHFSTGKDNWETPDDLFALYDSRYRFVLDAAADSTNHKCRDWFGPDGIEPDALVADWGPWLERGNIWLNPPYSRGLQAKFVRKALDEVWTRGYMGDRHTLGNVVCLLPARTDTKLFHDFIRPWGDVEFLRGRLKFKGAKHFAPFPSMVVIF